MRVTVLSLLAVLFMCGGAAFAAEQGLYVDLADDHIDITTGFNGSRIVLYGVKDAASDVAVVVRGPDKDIVVRKKERVAGAWMNRRWVTFKGVPEFYDFALSSRLIPRQSLEKHNIGVAALMFEPDDENIKDHQKEMFQNALIRTKQKQRLFPKEGKDLSFISDSFFKAEFFVPNNVPTGTYKVETYVFNGDTLVDLRETSVRVAQVGFSAGIYKFAHSYSFAYALVIVMIAAYAGWFSNAVRRKNNVGNEAMETAFDQQEGICARHQRAGGVYLVVADNSDDFDIALRYAAQVAEANGCRIGILHIIEDQGFQPWGDVEARIRQEQRDLAEKALWKAAHVLDELGCRLPAFYVAEGGRMETLARVIEEDSNITLLILGGGTQASGPGPLVSHFTTKGLAKLRVPIMIVPDHLKL